MLKKIVSYLRSILINPYRGFLSKSEFNRIKKLERFTKGSTILLGKRVEFSDNYGFLCSVREIFIENQSHFVSDKVNPFIIDCGSNIGLTVIYYKMIYPDAKIIAFEPDEEVYDILEKNVKEFNFKDVSIYMAAVWSENKDLVFYSQGSLAGSLESGLSEGKREISVKGIRLKDYIPNEEVDFINMDIEGAESTVIPDISEELKYVKSLFIEYHSLANKTQNLSEILKTVELAGFKYYIRNLYNQINFIDRKQSEDEFDLVLCIHCYKSI
jgi:FkbM family methyltransferase